MKRFLMLLMILFASVLTACEEDPEVVTHPEVVSAIDDLFGAVDQAFTLDEETTLPNVVEGAIVTWTSDSTYVDETGNVTLPTDEDEVITIAVSIKKGGATQELDYTVTLIASGDDPVVDGDYKIIPDQRVTDGALVISGGNSSSNLQDIDDAFIGLGGGNDHIHILIVPTSSGGPTASAVNSMKNSYMGRYGLTEDQFSVLDVTTTTTHLADDAAEVAKVEQATAIWFTGGDQYRVTSSLWREDGSASDVLAKIFEKWEDGNIVIGGSSAGAAIMSRVMIGGGLSVGSLAYDHVASRFDYTGDKYTYGALQVNNDGFGFFDAGVVDQHFDTRDRLGRLIEAAYVEGDKAIGFGVAENSAMIYDHTTKEIRVIGEVTIVDTRNATRTKTATNLSRYENIRLSLLRGASTYNVATEEFTFLRADGKPMEDITDTPSYSDPFPTNITQFGGFYDSLYDFIAMKLLDNRKTDLYVGRGGMPYVSSFTIDDHEYYRELNDTTDRIIFEKRFFYEDGRTEGWYDPADRSYSFKDVVFDIIPLEDNLTEQQ